MQIEKDFTGQNSTPEGLSIRDNGQIANAERLNETKAEQHITPDVITIVEDPRAGFRLRRETDRIEGERQSAAIARQFIEESQNRGFGLREIEPIRSEEIKSKKYRIGAILGMAFASVLGIANASQAIDLSGLEMDLLIRLSIICAGVLLTLFAFKAIAAMWLIPIVGDDSYRHHGEKEINRWVKILGALFFFIAIPSIFLRMDTGLPEVVGLIFWILWEFITVLIAALAAHAAIYYSWSSDLARKYHEARKLLAP